MKLTLKFALLMLIPLTGLAFTGYVANLALKKLADFHVKQQARLLMEAMSATRDYTKLHIKPKLHFESADGKFNKETVPAFAAHETLKYITSKDTSDHTTAYDASLHEYDYKEASDNPTNSLHRATAEEVEIIRRLGIKESEEGTSQDRSSWYLAKPLVASESEGCMDCHGAKEKAPASMLAAYGPSVGGFNWPEGEVVAAQIVYVPKTVPDQIAYNAVRNIAIIIILAGAITILALWWALTVLVTRPVARLSDMAEEISKGHLSAHQIPVTGSDEIAQLTASFNRMNQSLYKAVKKLKES
jgi:protein-histidine pros-kinase